MKLKKIALAFAVMGMTSISAQAANQGSGTVTFKGEIIEAPCSIKPESVDQTVKLGQISNQVLKNGGSSNPETFFIELEDCELVTSGADKNSTISVKFTGPTSTAGSDLLGFSSGVASGAGILLSSEAGKIIPGQLNEIKQLTDGPNKLRFTAALQGSKASGAVVTPGDFETVANFSLSYH